jgi:hypothetical protein
MVQIGSVFTGVLPGVNRTFSWVAPGIVWWFSWILRCGLAAHQGSGYHVKVSCHAGGLKSPTSCSATTENHRVSQSSCANYYTWWCLVGQAHCGRWPQPPLVKRLSLSVHPEFLRRLYLNAH